MYSYSENFKKQVVKKVLSEGIKQIDICRKLNLSFNSVRNWRKQYADEVKNEIKQIDIDSLFIEEEVDIDRLLLQAEPLEIRNEKEIFEKIIAKEKIPAEYTIEEKYVIISAVRKMPKDQIGLILRNCGLQSEHIKLWEDEILSMGKKQINHDEYIKKLEAEVKELKKKLKNSEQEKHELEVLIELKKKYKLLFKQDGEEE
jgi:transposase-like protein